MRARAAYYLPQLCSNGLRSRSRSRVRRSSLNHGRVGVASFALHQGHRDEMQDFCRIELQGCLAGVFDGMAKGVRSDFVAETATKVLGTSFEPFFATPADLVTAGQVARAAYEGVRRLDARILVECLRESVPYKQKGGVVGGSTAAIVAKLPAIDGRGAMTIATNLGDARIYLLPDARPSWMLTRDQNMSQLNEELNMARGLNFLNSFLGHHEPLNPNIIVLENLGHNRLKVSAFLDFAGEVMLDKGKFPWRRKKHKPQLFQFGKADRNNYALIEATVRAQNPELLLTSDGPTGVLSKLLREKSKYRDLPFRIRDRSGSFYVEELLSKTLDHVRQAHASQIEEHGLAFALLNFLYGLNVPNKDNGAIIHLPAF